VVDQDLPGNAARDQVSAAPALNPQSERWRLNATNHIALRLRGGLIRLPRPVGRAARARGLAKNPAVRQPESGRLQRLPATATATAYVRNSRRDTVNGDVSDEFSDYVARCGSDPGATACDVPPLHSAIFNTTSTRQRSEGLAVHWSAARAQHQPGAGATIDRNRVSFAQFDQAGSFSSERGRGQVRRWRERYAQVRQTGIERDLPRGAPPVKVDVGHLVALTTESRPEAATH
jgi:hypothetical protein